MFLEVIRSQGLSHLSYLLGDGTRAVVIDPRRDCDVYIERAREHGARIHTILETHRNEDYVIGSRELAARTGAVIYHGGAGRFGYGRTACGGERFRIGGLVLEVLETPGHTDDSLSFVLYDTESAAETAIGVFTGDALLVGGVGRADFYPERREQVAGLLYDSIVDRLLPLGDQAIVYPAHGAGSVCGAGLAHRDFSTLGYERRHNPMLQLDRERFVALKSGERPYVPPYFGRMEVVNRKGPRVLGRLPEPLQLSPDELADAQAGGALVLDLREPEAVAGALIPGSLAIPLGLVPSFAGWFIPYGRDLVLVTDSPREVDTAVRHLVRLGYERMAGFLGGGLHAWETAGRHYASIPSIPAEQIRERSANGDPYTLLDVRGREEVESGVLLGSTTIYVGELPDRLDEIPKDRPVTTFCSTGARSIIAASLLLQAGFGQVEVCLGSMKACRAVGCEIVTPEGT